jgi:bifunctional non-homologous end joining protein LigD
MTVKSMQVGERKVDLSNADKVLFPEKGYTEGDLAEYYQIAAPFMIPHLTGRPISMQRFPNGVDKAGFYAKEAPDYFPDWIDRATVEVLETGETQPQVVVNNPETLVYLADQACITPHTWLSRVDHLHNPDKLIFDLDPPESFESARAAARSLRTLLDELGLVAYIMATGGRGLHIGVPLDGRDDFDFARDFARSLSDVLAAREPDRLTTETRKKARRGRLFLDYLRNAYGQTSVPPFAVRARSNATIATPLWWDELDDPDLNSQSYTMENIRRRLEDVGDPWADFHQRRQSLREARERLKQLAGQAI